jgi:hypothetical protein
MDGDKNRRPWHAKMLALLAREYSALMIGSSNFTCAGMGVGQHRNTEANLLTIVDRAAHSREVGELEAVWPDMETLSDPESAEWLGAQPDREEEEQQAKAPSLPLGFLSATYRAGDKRRIILRLDPEELPDDWRVHACGQHEGELLSAVRWKAGGRRPSVELDWSPVEPPERLLVRWAEFESFLPLNVEDSGELLPPMQLDHMSADDMLGILAAADPSAAIRAWVRRQQPSDLFDSDLDSATPIDLDPLRRYDLQATFLHRIGRRARILAQLRSNLQRPVYSRQALERRLRGLVGIEQLADRLLRECVKAERQCDEALLTLADFLIVLLEVEYRPSDGSLAKAEFATIFRPFLGELAERLGREIEEHRDRMSVQVMAFWEQVVQRCRG